MTQDGSFPYAVLADLGYRAPAQQDRGSDAVQTVDVSPELIDVLAADDILLLTDAGTEDAVAQLRQNPLFTGLGARVTELPSKDFLFGNVLTAQALVETARRHRQGAGAREEVGRRGVHRDRRRTGADNGQPGPQAECSRGLFRSGGRRRWASPADHCCLRWFEG
jgi:hypothetical protein